MRGVVPYDVSRPLCVVGGGAVKIPKIVPAASLGLGRDLGRTKPAGRFPLGDEGSHRPKGWLPDPTPPKWEEGMPLSRLPGPWGCGKNISGSSKLIPNSPPKNELQIREFHGF